MATINGTSVHSSFLNGQLLLGEALRCNSLGDGRGIEAIFERDEAVVIGYEAYRTNLTMCEFILNALNKAIEERTFSLPIVLEDCSYNNRQRTFRTKE